jgi:hypothetical protein
MLYADKMLNVTKRFVYVIFFMTKKQSTYSQFFKTFNIFALLTYVNKALMGVGGRLSY